MGQIHTPFKKRLGELQDLIYHKTSSLKSVRAYNPHLNPSMAAQVEVELGRVCDGAVHSGACWDITALPNLQVVINNITVKTRTIQCCTTENLDTTHHGRVNSY